MDRKTIKELMDDTDYVYGASQNIQGIPLTDNNVSIMYNIQQLMKHIFIELKKELDSISESEENTETLKVEEQQIGIMDIAKEHTKDVSEDA